MFEHKILFNAIPCEHRRTGRHPFGGQTEFCRMDSVGGGVVAEIFRDPYSVGRQKNFS